MKSIAARAGERTKVLHIFSDSIPQTVRFTATPAGAGGTVEVVRRRWFVRRPPEVHPLRAEQAFDKGFADVDYTIHVTPDRDVTIAFQSRHFERKALFWVLGGVIVLAVVAALIVPLLAR